MPRPKNSTRPSKKPSPVGKAMMRQQCALCNKPKGNNRHLRKWYDGSTRFCSPCYDKTEAIFFLNQINGTIESPTGMWLTYYLVTNNEQYRMFYPNLWDLIKDTNAHDLFV